MHNSNPVLKSFKLKLDKMKFEFIEKFLEKETLKVCKCFLSNFSGICKVRRQELVYLWVKTLFDELSEIKLWTALGCLFVGTELVGTF